MVTNILRASTVCMVALCLTGCFSLRLDAGLDRPAGLVRAPAPGDQSADALFPEQARAVALAQLPIDLPDWPPSARYNFDLCETVDNTVSEDSVRAFGRYLDGGRRLFSQSFPEINDFCTQDSCYLRVNTAHVGRTVVLTEKDVPCDDPRIPGMGVCDIGIDSITARGNERGYRGNVVIADRIQISGRIRLGHLALVLIARQEVQFLPGAVIEGGQSLRPPTDAPPGVGTTLPGGGSFTTCVGREPRTGFPIYGSVSDKRYLRFFPGAPNGTGAPSAEIAKLMLVAPRVTGSGAITLEGRPGGRGGNGADALCHFSTVSGFDLTCALSVERFFNQQPGVGSDGGRGGRGGPGGTLVLRTAEALPASISVSLAGGAGGAGGFGGAYLMIDPYCAQTVSNTTVYAPIGVDGAPGPIGAGGTTDNEALGERWADYAFLFARRGAERHWQQGLHHARAVLEEPSRTEATRYLDIVDRNYCTTSDATFVLASRPSIRISSLLPSSSAAPSSYAAADATRTAHKEFCEELAIRQRWIRDQVNLYGLPRDFYLYLRPDILYGYRERALAAVDTLGTTFWRTVAQQQDAIDAQSLSQQASGVARTSTDAYEVAVLREALLRQKVIFSVDRLKQNRDSLELMQSELQSLRDKLDPMLEPQSCDFFCILGAFWRVITGIVSVVGALSTALDSITGFFETWSQLDFAAVKTEALFYNNLYPGGDVTELERQASWTATEVWVDQIAKGIDGQPGLEAVAAGASDLSTKVTTLTEGFSAAAVAAPPRTALDMVASAWNSNIETERQLVTALGEVNAATANLENGSYAVKDQNGAIGVLLQMRDVVLLRIERTRESQRLLEENLLASMEVRVAREERIAAQRASGFGRALATRLACRTGLVSGQACSDVWPLVPATRLADVRNETCRLARDANDTALLFDYFYHRSRDFVDLGNRTLQGDAASLASHDFRRNFLIPAQRQALALTNIDSLDRDFISVLQPLTDGVHIDGFCRPGATCTFASSANARSNEQFIADLLEDGRAYFEVTAPVPERQKQRVTGFDLRVHSAPPYRLGCSALAPCPAAVPPDTPYARRYEYRYGHDPRAVFRWDDGTAREIYFSPAYPQQACEIIRSRLSPASQQIDCRSIAAFEGRGAHESVIANQLAASVPIERQTYHDPLIFGTSVRGQWNVNIRDTIAALGADDQCYAFSTSVRLPAQCYPSSCLSPCFDDAGQRRTPAEGAPAFCNCYDAAGSLTPSAGPLCAGGLPASIRFLNNPPEAPEVCRTNVAFMTPLEESCVRFVSQGQLRDHGDERCCDTAGHAKAGLSVGDRQMCEFNKLATDTQCRTPDVCYSICGPRCKAFKRSITGLEYRIYWRSP